MGRDRIIEAYIQRLLSWEQPLTSVTLTEIAEEVGLTISELDAIKTQAETHLTRGRAYIEFGCLDDALQELNQAATLTPLNLEVLHTLANTYSLRYNRTNDATDRQKALLIARRCVELKPDDKEALVLISFLEHNPDQSRRQASQWTQQKLAMVAGGVVTVGLGVMGLSRLLIFPQPLDPLGPAPGTIVPGSAIYDSTGSAEAAEAAPEPVKIALTSDVDIPVLFDHPGLVMEARLSELGDYEDELYYHLQGVFVNASDQEFRNLVLNIEFLDDSETAIATTTKAAISDQDATIRPGDTHTFNLLQEITPELATVRLSVTSLQQAPARKTYVPPTPINYSWPGLEPDNISFELASRSEEFSVSVAAQPQPALAEAAPEADSATGAATDPATGAATGSDPATGGDASPGPQDAAPSQPRSGPATFNAEWVIINTSNSPISELKLKTDFYSANEQQLQSENVSVIHNNDAPLLPGEIRPFRVIQPIVNGYERYKVTVVEAE